MLARGWMITRGCESAATSAARAGEGKTGGTGGAGRQMFAVRPGDPVKDTKPEVAYEVKPPIPYVPTSVTDGRLVFFFCDGGIAGCLEAASGKVL